jgi:hypothetical protein
MSTKEGKWVLIGSLASQCFDAKTSACWLMFNQNCAFLGGYVAITW